MKKSTTKKRRINSKKGISMVLAIALVAVLFLTTTSFLSIAMLQQKETGTSMNSRQAYVSSKSALDIAEDFLNDGKLTLPKTPGESKYYVFYYDASGDVKVIDYSTASEAQKFIDDAGTNGYTVIGNAYVKITKNEDGSYTITAVGSESKYNNTNGGNTGDISAKFEVKEHWEQKKVETSLRMSEKKISTPPPGGSTGYFMLGDQTAFTLVRSAEPKLKGGSQNNHYRTLSRSSPKNGNVFYALQVEAESAPITSFFPLVFDKTVLIDSNNGSRCSYTAYNNGIYLLGNSPSTGIDMTYPEANNNIALYTKNNSYGATLSCKYLVIGGNLLSMTDNSCQSLTLKYAGDNYKRDGGIVINFTNDVDCKNYKNDGTKTTVTYKKGYYYLPIADNTNGVDLFAESTHALLNKDENKINTTDLSKDQRYKNLNGIDNYSSMLDSKGNLKKMHSAYEENAIGGATPTCFLDDSGKFQGGSLIADTTFRNTKPTVNGKPFTDWDDYYTYCAPSVMPNNYSNKTYIDLYAGEEFNYLWYNINKMEVNSNININIRSNNVVLSIGPELGEEIYYNSNYNSSKTVKNQQTIPSNFKTSGNYDSNSPYTATNQGINTIIQNGSDSSFSVMPYWGGESFTLSVINDFTVQRENGSTYKVKAGKYTDIPKDGLDLFTDKAEEYFKDHSTETKDSYLADIDWVNEGSINTSVPDSNLNKSSYAINFKAPNGGTLKSSTYKAKAIYCDFGHTVKGNNATLKGDVISIGADELDCKGADELDGKGDGKDTTKYGLFIDTSGGSPESKCELITGTTKEQVDGSLLHITRDTKLVLDDGLTYSLKEGYYYFPNKTKFNILSSDFWQEWTASKPYYYSEEINKDNIKGTSIYNEIKTDKVSFEGKYF